MPPSSPTVASWELGLRLKEARDQLDWRGTAAAETLGVSQNYLSDIEHGKRKISAEKLIQLMNTYEIANPEREELLALRITSEGNGWWMRYKGLLAPDLLRLLGCEHGAQEMHIYEGAMVTGLLQTERYSRAIHNGDGANLRTSDVERRVAVRLQRQERLGDPDPLRVSVLMTETALRQQVGGPTVLAEQLNHLLTLMDKHANTLDLRIIPFTADSYGAIGSSTFHLLTFPGPHLRRLAWQETVTWLQLIDSAERIHQYSLAFNEALGRAADREESKRIIKQALEVL